MIIRDCLTCCQETSLTPLATSGISLNLWATTLAFTGLHPPSFSFRLLSMNSFFHFSWFTSLLFPSFVLRMANSGEPFLPCFTYLLHTLVYRPTENADVKIVAVDLQLMAPIPGVVQIHGDITKVRMRRFDYTLSQPLLI